MPTESSVNYNRTKYNHKNGRIMGCNGSMRPWLHGFQFPTAVYCVLCAVELCAKKCQITETNFVSPSSRFYCLLCFLSSEIKILLSAKLAITYHKSFDPVIKRWWRGLNIVVQILKLCKRKLIFEVDWWMDSFTQDNEGFMHAFFKNQRSILRSTKDHLVRAQAG